jgi:hypothetical protein
MSFHRPEFWVSVSDVPGRSFLLFEWFEPRHTETEKEFAARQKIEQADHVQFFYLQEMLKNELSFVVFLKFIFLTTPLLIFPDPGNMVRDVHPGFVSRIRILIFYPFRILSSKKHQIPQCCGSGSTGSTRFWDFKD